MNPGPPSARRHGLTLIELLISTAIAMMMAALCVSAYLEMRKAVLYYEGQLAMNDRAEVLYANFYRDCQSTMQHCAMVLSQSPSQVSWIFMRGKDDAYDYNPLVYSTIQGTDTVWEEWLWQGGRLRNGRSTPVRTFAISSAMTYGGTNYSGYTCNNMPQPRRWLDPTTPLQTLDDNIYFPGANGTSTANALGDVGDATDLARNIAPVADGVTNLTIQCVFHDGSVQTFDGTSTATVVIPGVYMDGRLAPRLSDLPNYSQSAIPMRPELMRLRFTLSDATVGLNQTYAFSFALPGLNPTG